jgi:hypothetical protein
MDLQDRLTVLRLSNAAFFASGLFWDSFKVPFPVPREDCGLPIPTPPEAWSQYVALYRWPDGMVETVGFCNWIRYNDVYLEGGMCVRPGFYRRLPRADFDDCKHRGGVAQIMMETAATQLTDCAAWFGFCGDRKAYLVDMRFGYEPTEIRNLIVKWFQPLPDLERQRRIEMVSRIGPF